MDLDVSDGVVSNETEAACLEVDGPGGLTALHLDELDDVAGAILEFKIRAVEHVALARIDHCVAVLIANFEGDCFLTLPIDAGANDASDRSAPLGRDSKN